MVTYSRSSEIRIASGPHDHDLVSIADLIRDSGQEVPILFLRLAIYLIDADRTVELGAGDNRPGTIDPGDGAARAPTRRCGRICEAKHGSPPGRLHDCQCPDESRLSQRGR